MPDVFPPIFVLRHGETEWNATERLQGHLDSPLTARGKEQAARQNTILQRVLPENVAAVVSDSGRAVHTAQIALDGMDVPVRYDPRLREVALGEWQGLTPIEIEAQWYSLVGDRDTFEWKFHAPGGETLDMLTDRARAVLQSLTGPSVLVTHGMTSRVLRCIALGRPPTDLAELPGGQGVVHVIENGKARLLQDDTP